MDSAGFSTHAQEVSLQSSNLFVGSQVVTMRSKGSVKYSIPCLVDPVSKLEGLGVKTKKNLVNIRAGVRKIDARLEVPDGCPNEVKTGQQFL